MNMSGIQAQLCSNRCYIGMMKLYKIICDGENWYLVAHGSPVSQLFIKKVKHCGFGKGIERCNFWERYF